MITGMIFTLSAQNGLELTTGNSIDYKIGYFLYVILYTFIRCLCGHCQPMDTAQESICCIEIDKISDLLVGAPPPSV